MSVLAVLLLGRVIAFGKELLVAAWFGGESATDVFYLGWLIPATLANLIGPAVETALVPHLVRRQTQRLAAWQLFRAVSRKVVEWTMILAAAIFVFAEPLVKLMIGADSALSARTEAAVECLRIMAVYLPAHVFIFLLSGALASNRRFGWSAMWMVTSSVVTVLVLLPGESDTGRPPAALAYAVMLGYVIALFVQIVLVAFISPRQSARPVGRPGLQAEIAGVLGDAWPLAAAATIPQLAYLIDLAIAGRLYEGAVSALQRGSLLANTLLILTVRAIANPGLVAMSSTGGRGSGVGGLGPDRIPEPSRETSMASANLGKDPQDTAGPVFARFVGFWVPLVLWILPASVFLTVYAESVVRVTLGRGEFSANAIRLTSESLRWYSAGLVFQATVLLLAQAFSAASATRVWFRLVLPSLAIHLGLNLLFLNLWPDNDLRHAGIALSATVTHLLTACVGLAKLRGLSSGSDGNIRIGAMVRALAIGGAGAGAAALAAWWTTERFGGSDWERLAMAAAVGGLVYLPIRLILGVCKAEG